MSEKNFEMSYVISDEKTKEAKEVYKKKKFVIISREFTRKDRSHRDVNKRKIEVRSKRDISLGEYESIKEGSNSSIREVSKEKLVDLLFNE